MTAVTTGMGPAYAAGTTRSVIEYAGKTAPTEPPATSASGCRTIELRFAPLHRQTWAFASPRKFEMPTARERSPVALLSTMMASALSERWAAKMPGRFGIAGGGLDAGLAEGAADSMVVAVHAEGERQ